VAKPVNKAKPRDVYVYFDNDRHAHAPHDALALQRAGDFSGVRKPAKAG
jgi:uncharacterized protein YecE (DUF72 family)